MVYTVTLNPALDCVLHCPPPVLGGVNRAASQTLAPGGKGINVACMLRNLGVEARALGFVAGPTGTALEQALAAQGIATEFVRLPGGDTRVNVKIKADLETELNAPGPPVTPADWAKLEAQLARLAPGDGLVLAGSAPAGVPQDGYARLLQTVAGKGVRTVVDAEGSLLACALAARPWLVKPNHVELAALFDRELHTDAEVADCAARLQAQGARNVLVSMAAQGALLLDEAGTVHRMAAPAGRVQNSVGAGDAMVAGFLAGYWPQKSWDDALRLGIAAGSATAFSPGIADAAAVRQVLAALA